MKQGLILDKDGDPWLHCEEGFEILEQDGGELYEWLEELTDGFSPTKNMDQYGPRSLEIPIEYLT